MVSSTLVRESLVKRAAVTSTPRASSGSRTTLYFNGSAALSPIGLLNCTTIVVLPVAPAVVTSGRSASTSSVPVKVADAWAGLIGSPATSRTPAALTV